MKGETHKFTIIVREFNTPSRQQNNLRENQEVYRIQQYHQSTGHLYNGHYIIMDIYRKYHPQKQNTYSFQVPIKSILG